MDIQDYTSPAEVRLLLGISGQELSDDVFSLPIVAHWLSMGLESVYSGLVSAYEIWVNKTPQSAEEKRAILAVRVYSAYVLAYYLQYSAGRTLLKKISDGRASEERFARGREDLAVFLEQMNDAKRALLDALFALDLIDAPVERAPAVYFASADLIPDPVVGENL